MESDGQNHEMSDPQPFQAPATTPASGVLAFEEREDWQRALVKADAAVRFAWLWLAGWSLVLVILLVFRLWLLPAMSSCALLAGVIGLFVDRRRRRRLAAFGATRGWTR